MATCQSEQELESYVAGTATPEQMAVWKIHLNACDPCAAKDAAHIERIVPLR